VGKYQGWLKSDHNNGYLKWRPTYVQNSISMSHSYNEKCFTQLLYSKSKHILHVQELFPKIVPFMRYCGKMWERGAGHRRQYNMAHALFILENKGHTHTHTHTQTQNMYYLLFFHGNNGRANAPECNVVRTLPVLFIQCPSVLENFKEWRKKTEQQLGVKYQFPRILRRTGCEDSAVFGDQTMKAAGSPSHWNHHPEPQTTLVWN
jgi:hypothetical protein